MEAVVFLSTGGAGKTQLMVSFANCARKQGLVPGGVFWVTADGNKEKVLSSFVEIAESLGRFALPVREKSSTRAVVDLLRRALGKVEGRWLLCVDNADSADSAEVLEKLQRLRNRNVDGYL